MSTRYKNIPSSELSKIIRGLQKLVLNSDYSDLISEEEAAKLLGMKKVSLQARRRDGTIPAGSYVKTVTGGYVYHRSKLLISE